MSTSFLNFESNYDYCINDYYLKFRIYNSDILVIVFQVMDHFCSFVITYKNILCYYIIKRINFIWKILIFLVLIKVYNKAPIKLIKLNKFTFRK